ncbi:hypothetical protein [Pseudonocardia cypriaca]|uniref:ABC-type transport system involved in multi-copper enzyme maturation permease subunit n=1 Tax=Pseudonocardia cypriaca TaxID=882449 RepID=A0A543FYP6_9PSEU|nr:hypothetical protein [Pseudonocardia cypriaca]TQM38968.1 ABC-type transport system involved in multi-copper enzyme maturation permease subunit [Pseudonocardia cypriaca]
MTTGQGQSWAVPAGAAPPGPPQQPGATPSGPGQPRPGQPGPVQAGVAQAGAVPSGPVQLGAAQLGAVQLGAVQHGPGQHGWGQQAPVQQGQPQAGQWPGGPGPLAEAPGVAAPVAQQLPSAGAGPAAPGWGGPQAHGASATAQHGLAADAETATPPLGAPQAQAPSAMAKQVPTGGAGTVAQGWGGPQAQATPAQPVPQVAPPPAPPGSPSGGPFAAASRRIPFRTLVVVELRKLTGTLSDRILLALAPVVLVGITVLIHKGTDYASTYASAEGQISPTFYTVRIGHVLLHAVLIKLIAGEWQHRSAQPTLLVQPSRARYFLAQATVVLMLWVLAAGLQLGTTLLVAPAAVTDVGATYLLGYRIGWVVGVCVLGSLLTILVALTVAMLVPNAAGALAIYFATVPVMLTISGLAPEVFAWVDPSSATAALATVAPVEGPGPVIVSLVLWAGLLGLAGYRVARRDLA